MKLAAFFPLIILLFLSRWASIRSWLNETEVQKAWKKQFRKPGKTRTVLLLLGVALLIGLIFWAEHQQVDNAANADRSTSSQEPNPFQLTKPSEIKTRFSDVYGLEQAKRSLNDFILAIKNPETFSRIGAKPPKAVLLYGPPGNGKTLLVRALAGEAGVNVISVTGSSFVEKWVGLGAARVRELFSFARQNKPCIIFIDEFEVLVPNREKMTNEGGNSEYHSTVNQFLSELDGFLEEKNKGVYLVAATNYIENIDPAVIRSGRFNAKVYLGLPSRDEQLGILKIHLAHFALEDGVSPEKVMPLVKKSWSGADIAAFVNEAASEAARRSDSKVGMVHFRYAAQVFQYLGNTKPLF